MTAITARYAHLLKTGDVMVGGGRMTITAITPAEFSKSIRITTEDEHGFSATADYFPDDRVNIETQA